MFALEAPVSGGKSFLAAMATNGLAPQIHKEWFMDQLHEGDQVLFTAKCNKHNDCTFWLPDPDRQGKEFITAGHFVPDVAKTNTQTLCGMGKLSAAVEAQVCGQAPTPATAPAPTTK